MSDTPTTAEEVIEGWFLSGYRADYLAECLNSGTVPDDSWEPHAGMRSQARANAEQLAALVRSSPAVLADLNGGEWVQPKDAAGKVPVWFQKFRDAWPEKRKPSEIGRTRPLFVFVPKRATDD